MVVVNDAHFPFPTSLQIERESIEGILSPTSLQ